MFGIVKNGTEVEVALAAGVVLAAEVEFDAVDCAYCGRRDGEA